MISKTIHYRRGVWFGGPQQNLSSVIVRAIENHFGDNIPPFETNNENECAVVRTFVYPNIDRVFIHFVSFEAGAPAAIVSSAAQANNFDVDEAEAPEGNEFIKSQLLLMVEGNNCVYVTHNSALREGTVTQTLRSFITASGLDNDETLFAIQAVLDPEIARMMLEGGVSQIDIGLGAFRTTLESMRNGDQLPDRGLISVLSGLVARDLTDEQIEAASQISSSLTLKPGRSWSSPNVHAYLVDVSENLLTEHDEGFAIVTKESGRLTHSKMSINRNLSLPGNSATLIVGDAMRELVRYLENLRNDGIFGH